MTTTLMSATISVVIPCYDQVKYLYRAVSSVAWQLRPGDEVVVIDDCSPQFVGFDSLSRFRDCIVCIRNESRKGVSFSRNRAILQCQAEWIKFLDADDVLAPYALDALRNSLRDMQPTVQVLVGGMHRVTDCQYCDYLEGTGDSFKSILNWNPFLPSTAFVRREALLNVGMFDEQIDFEEDWDLWLKIHEKFGPSAFRAVRQPICYYWIQGADRKKKKRTALRDGIPVREYFRMRYGADPK